MSHVSLFLTPEKYLSTNSLMCFQQQPGFMKGTVTHSTLHFYLFLPSDLRTQTGAPEVLRHSRSDEDAAVHTGLLLRWCPITL